MGEDEPKRPVLRAVGVFVGGLAMLSAVLFGLRGLGWALDQVLPAPKPSPSSTEYREPATVCVYHDSDGCSMWGAP